MEYKTCSKCYIEKPIKSFYRDLTTRDGLTSACKPCRSKQVSRARIRRDAKAKGLVVDDSPELLEHNLETLQRITNLEERPIKLNFRTQLIGALEPIEQGLRLINGMAYIETVHGLVSKDLSRNTLKSIARFLENHRIKIIERVEHE